MSVKKIALASAVAAATATTTAFAVDMHGYGRVGNGLNADGGEADCGHSVQQVGRLGNECDFFAEIVLAQNIYEKEMDSGDVSFDFATRFALANDPVRQDWETITPSWREYYVSATGVWGNSSSLWMGKRFYKRQDVHITDDYIIATDGPGFGIENIAAGPGNLHLAWLISHDSFEDYTDLNKADAVSGVSVAANTIDIRYDGLQVNNNGFLDLQLRVGFANYSSADEEAANARAASITDPNDPGYEAAQADKKKIDNLNTAFELAAFHTQSGLLGGFNRVGILYSTEGLAKGQGNSLKSWNAEANGETKLRIFDTFQFAVGNWSMMGVASFTMTDSDASNDAGTAMNFVFRPQYHFNDYNALAFEVGYFVESHDSKKWWYPGDAYTPKAADDLNAQPTQDSNSGYKLTAAYTVRAGKSFWARPEMRFYVSYNGGDTAINGRTEKQNESAATSSLNFGWQTELWF